MLGLTILNELRVTTNEAAIDTQISMSRPDQDRFKLFDSESMFIGVSIEGARNCSRNKFRVRDQHGFRHLWLCATIEILCDVFGYLRCECFERHLSARCPLGHCLAPLQSLQSCLTTMRFPHCRRELVGNAMQGNRLADWSRRCLARRSSTILGNICDGRSREICCCCIRG